jgi:hypothetical protein
VQEQNLGGFATSVCLVITYTWLLSPHLITHPDDFGSSPRVLVVQGRGCFTKTAHEATGSLHHRLQCRAGSYPAANESLLMAAGWSRFGATSMRSPILSLTKLDKPSISSAFISQIGPETSVQHPSALLPTRADSSFLDHLFHEKGRNRLMVRRRHFNSLVARSRNLGQQGRTEPES